LSCDNIIGVDMITANGEFIQASQEENQDLFWAIKGGGGNYGIVTCFQFKLHPIGKVVLSQTMFSITNARKILQKYAKFSKESPDTISPFFWLTKEHATIMSVSVGSVEKISAELDNFLKEFNPIFHSIEERDYADVQCFFDSANGPGNYYWSKSNFFTSIDDNIIDILIKSMENSSQKSTTIEIMCLGGAIGRVKPEDTAFFHRNAHYEIHAIVPFTTIPKETLTEISEWARKFAADLAPLSTGGGYLNINTAGTKPQNQYGTNFIKLQQVKQKYDPSNFFHMNHNILPQ